MRRLRLKSGLLVAVGGLLTSPAVAQTVAELNHTGAAAMTRRDPAAALAYFTDALAEDSVNHEAQWRSALALVDLAKQVPPARKDRHRDTLYIRAVELARKATASDPTSAQGHFLLALSLGQQALTKGPRDRLRVVREVRDEAQRALAIDSLHDGAHHVLGRWHAEARRLSGVSRFVARTFLSGDVLGESSWDQAVRHLERAVALRPQWIYHRLDLARVYLERDRADDARPHLIAIDTLPLGDVMDETYRQEARDLLRRIGGR